MRPGCDVRIGYLDHGPPLLADLDSTEAVVVPLLLGTGFHVSTDIPAVAPRARVAAAIGPDPLLAEVLLDRLREAGWDGRSTVILAAAGSADPRAIADANLAAEQLAELAQVEVTAAFTGSGSPRLRDMHATTVASYVLGPGHFANLIAGSGARLVSAPIGADPRVAELVVSRYEAALR